MIVSSAWSWLAWTIAAKRAGAGVGGAQHGDRGEHGPALERLDDPGRPAAGRKPDLTVA